MEEREERAKRTNFFRRCCLVLHVGALILRIFIDGNVQYLQEKNLSKFLQSQPKKIKNKLKKYEKHYPDLMEAKQRYNWDLSVLYIVFDLMHSSLKFEFDVNLFASFLNNERNKICHAAAVEMNTDEYQAFLETFDEQFKKINLHFEDDCVKDFNEKIAEIKSTQCENLEKKQDFEAAKFNVLMDEWNSLNEAEKKNKIEELKEIMTDGKPTHVTLRFEFAEMENLINFLNKWMTDTENGSKSKSLRQLLDLIQEVTGSSNESVSIGSLMLGLTFLSSKDCISLLPLMDSNEMKKCLRNLATEISSYTGKEIEIAFDTIFMMHQETLHGRQKCVKAMERKSMEHMTPEVGKTQIKWTIRSFDNDRANIKGKFNKLESAVYRASNRDDLQQTILHHFANFKEEIKLKRDNLTTVKILVAAEKDSGANSFLNVVLGKSTFPAGTPSHNAMIFRKARQWQKLEIKSSTQTKSESMSPHFVKSALSSLRGCESHEKYKDKDDIIIGWPDQCDLLQDNIEWIIMPEEWEDASSREMLKDADGLLYIANSGSTEGPEHKKLKLISEFQHISLAIILNKWDHVEYSVYAAEVKGQHPSSEEIQRNMVQHLQRSCPKYDTNATIRFSVMQAKGFIDMFNGMDLDQEENAKTVLHNLMENSIKQNLNKADTWISSKADILKKCIEQMNAKANLVFAELSKEEKTINKTALAKKWLIDNNVQQKTENTAALIVNHIRSYQTRKEMNDWEYDDFPCSLVFDSNEKIKREVSEVVTRRLGRILARDMKKNLENLKEEMVEMAKTEIEDVKGTLKASHDIISRQNVKLNLHADVKGDLFNAATGWDGGLRHSIDLGIFFSPGFITLGFLYFPIAEFLSLIGDSKTGIHVEILQKASENLINSIDKNQISKMIDEELADFRKGVNTFFSDVVPQCVNEIDRVKVSINLTIQVNLEIKQLLTF